MIGSKKATPTAAQPVALTPMTGAPAEPPRNADLEELHEYWQACEVWATAPSEEYTAAWASHDAARARLALADHINTARRVTAVQAKGRYYRAVLEILTRQHAVAVVTTDAAYDAVLHERSAEKRHALETAHALKMRESGTLQTRVEGADAELEKARTAYAALWTRHRWY